MKVNTTNWPDICNVVIDSSRTIMRFRPTSAHVLRSTGEPTSPRGRRHASSRKLRQPIRADAAIDRAPAVAAGDEGDQRQADGCGERPSEKDVGNGAAAFFRGHDQRRGARGLRRIQRADRQHDQADDQQADVIRRKRGSRIGQRQHRERCGEQRPALDPAGQPRRQRRADAQHDRAESDQEARVADGDAKSP